MFLANIKHTAKENTDFRKVLFTGKNSQLVVMSIPVGGEIGEETHPAIDQILFFVDGDGDAILNDAPTPIKEHVVVFVPAGTKHNFKNTGDEDLKLYTVYSPPAHKDGTVHRTKEEAEKEEKY
jgi:mannose-6-phosphate isomerase-like protein (cupin superfamily)